MSTVSRLEHVMGLPVLFLIDEASAGALGDAVAWLIEVDRRFSPYRADSEISAFNRGELALGDLHPMVAAVLERCEQLRIETGGFFDIAAPYLVAEGAANAPPAAGRGRPGSVDPSGYVKGWAIAAAMSRLRRAGAENVAIYAGGDIIVHGHPEDGEAWRIGIEHPRERDRIALAVALSDGAVATSGTSARGAHIIDPFTGAAPEGLSSVTIIGPHLVTADVYATAAFAMGGERAAAWCMRLAGYEAVLIRADDTVLSTPGIAALRVA
jgi:thiamine biosynthesis lipoprotein